MSGANNVMDDSMFSLDVLPSPAIARVTGRPRSGSDPGAFTAPKPITTTSAGGHRVCLPHRASKVKFHIPGTEEEEVFITRPGSSTVRSVHTRRGSEPGVASIREQEEEQEEEESRSSSTSSSCDTPPLGASPEARQTYLECYPGRKNKRHSMF